MLTEHDMTHDDMQKAVASGYLCAVCQCCLSIAWSAAENCYILRCSNLEHTGITRHDIGYEKKILGGFSMDSKALQTMDETRMLARVDMARFPQELSPADKRLLAQVAITYGFDPLMGEVSIYQGRPYVSIDGRYRAAQETGKLDGVSSRPATKAEREEWEVPNGDYFFRAEVMVAGAKYPFVGWGRVFKSETIGGKGFKPVEKNPQRMAEKRAEAQALRKAFHIPLPSIEDIGTPEEEPATRVVSVSPGEVTEKPHDVAPVAQGTTATPQAVEVVTEGDKAAADAPYRINLDWLKESLATLCWTSIDVGQYLTRKYTVKGKTLTEMINKLDREQSIEFCAEVQKRLNEQEKNRKVN